MVEGTFYSVNCTSIMYLVKQKLKVKGGTHFDI